ncbi:MAG: DinB family protein [Bacteroidia bacterium]|nr:DinB family protein [Bacteroidia bacterium]HQV01410.1 DinB family protein [Bacteroidia bacterium]
MDYTKANKLIQYNLWANSLLMQWVIAAGNAAADTEVKSSFNTLRNTIYHIYDAQYVWFLRVQNQPLLHWPPSSNFNYTLAQFDIVLQQQSNDWLQFIATLKPNEFEQTIVYTNTKNQPFETTIADIITHWINHGTYHRGQCITMLHQLGFNAVGSTDYITFCRLK